MLGADQDRLEAIGSFVEQQTPSKSTNVWVALRASEIEDRLPGVKLLEAKVKDLANT